MCTWPRRFFILSVFGALGLLPAASGAAPNELDTKYLQIDAHAAAAPEDIRLNPAMLAAYLTKPFNTPEAKARAIYFWIINNIQYDATGYLAKTYISKSVEEILLTRNGICDGYAKLFQALADSAGIDVISIEGRVKTIDNGDDWPEDRANHVWNAIQIDGAWKIIDSTWGSGFVRKDGFRKKANHFFFLARPEDLLTSHFDLKDTFGLQEKHQLTIKEFLRMRSTPPSLLQLGFDGEKVLQTIRQKDFIDLVDTYDHPYGTMKVKQAPVSKTLVLTETKFEFSSDLFSEIAVFNNNHMAFYYPSESKFEFSYTPREPGSILIAGKRYSDEQYVGLLNYEVKEGSSVIGQFK